ncbi:hypothetical protein MalM25_24940 [Planctomycetes bacterium MalM25]|nr:hypothetical protein MalM25_24940 [Planctomycetes bacterium MalM25]
MPSRFAWILSLTLCTQCVVGALALELSEAQPFVAPPLPPSESGAEALSEKSILKRRAPVEGSSVEPESEPALAEAETPSPGAETPDADKGEQLRATLRASHPWVRYEPGAWRRLQTISEVFDESGAFAGRSVSERTERLVAVGDRTYTLSIEPVVELAGRRTPGPIETQELWLVNDRSVEEPVVAIMAGEPTSISLGDLAVPCRTWLIESGSELRAEKLTLYVSDQNEPAVLRRQGQTVLGSDAGPLAIEGVTRFGTPTIYGDELTATWQVESTTEHPTGERTEAFAIHGFDAPGGLHQEAVTEFDAAGAKTRWQVTRLVASGRTPSEDIGSPKPQNGPPSISVEVRPRRLLRLFRRGEAAEKAAPEQDL